VEPSAAEEDDPMSRYAGLRDRDYFHIMLNLDSHEEFLPTARHLAETFLDAAAAQLDEPTLEAELRFFPYTPEAYSARLDEVYQGLADDVARYEAQRGWLNRTRADVLEWMLQMAPFNQTDGAWLRGIAPVGPMDEVDALLFSIYSDEIGGGDPDRNHASIYTELLGSVGIDLPDVRSRDYAEHPEIVDAAYTLPLLQLVVGQFPQAYRPELLGMTQYLEWSAVELRSQVLLNRHFDIDTRFYEMHVAIDNATSGHGALAKRAVQHYLERIRVELGEEAMQTQWRRVWTGYVAFATTGNLGQQVAEKLRNRPTPAQRVAAVIQAKATKARLNHGNRRLGDTLLNDLFTEPDRLMAALVTSGRIVPGDPDASPFFALTEPDGPMFRVFTDPELATWRDWIRSLPAAPAPRTPSAGSAELMAELVDAKRPLQDGAPAHTATTLRGPDPDGSAAVVEHPVAWWFTRPAPALMAALASPDNGWVTPGDAANSRLVTQVLRGRNAMARALAADVDTITNWIDAGCPIPPPPRPLTLLSPPDRIDTHPTGAIHGTGSVH
jgi:Iron-containing redox enzyme